MRDLEVFMAVIEERKTTSAAERLGVSQPAVSRTLSQLEEKSGRKLFRTEGTGLVATADALALYEHIQPIFTSLEHLKHFEWTQPNPTPLRIACPPTAATCFLESLTAGFMRSNPDVMVSMDIVTTAEVLELVADQRTDIGVADVAGTNTGLQRVAFRRSQMVCVMPDTHAYSKKKRIEPQDLDGQAMVMLAKRNPIRPALDRILQKASSTPRVVMETSTALSAVHYAAQGLGITLVNPFPVLLTAPKGIVVRPFLPHIDYEMAFFTSLASVSSSSMLRYVEYVRQHQPDALEYSTPIR